jgi:hypothetical protein
LWKEDPTFEDIEAEHGPAGASFDLASVGHSRFRAVFANDIDRHSCFRAGVATARTGGPITFGGGIR